MNPADNAWVLASSALVLLMTPGLAMFYGGLTRSKNVLSTMMHSFFLMGLATAIWFVYGFTLSFGQDAFGGLIGGFQHFGLSGVGGAPSPDQPIPGATFMIFQCMFAVITPALISGAFAERRKFSSFIVYMALWMAFFTGARHFLNLPHCTIQAEVAPPRASHRARGRSACRCEAGRCGACPP